MDYKIKVDELFNYEFDKSESKDLDIIPLGNNEYQLIINNKTYKAIVLEADYKSKTFLLKINGAIFRTEVSDAFDQLVDKMGLSVVAGAKMNEVKAPMPGLILNILVQPGQTFTKGDPLLILEAMKMENVIKASGEGSVKNIVATQGDAVEKGQLLIELD